MTREQVGVVRREAPQPEDRTVARIEHDDRPLLLAERITGELLHVLPHCELDVAGVIAVDEQVAQRLVFLRHRCATQLVVVRLLDAGRAEVEVE